jgi:uncharacterized protein DUF1376
MTELPPPLVSAECDLRGMPYMAVELVRLLDSDFYALSTGDEFKAAFTLWSKAFMQLPAGSLPADDRILAHLSGAGANWPNVKEMALHGWFKCSDGRLYHHTVSEKVLDAWRCRCEKRKRTEAARAARAENRQQHNPISVTDNATESVTGSNRTEQNRTEEKKERSSLRSLGHPAGAGRPPAGFSDFWQKYPRKVAKGRARRAWDAAIRKTPPESILAALEVAAFDANPRFVPHPATWLAGERWADEVDTFDPVLRAAGLSEADFPPSARLLQ